MNRTEQVQQMVRRCMAKARNTQRPVLVPVHGKKGWTYNHPFRSCMIVHHLYGGIEKGHVDYNRLRRMALIDMGRGVNNGMD